MFICADFHMHSSFSGDSSAPMEEMIQKAVSQGLTHICFTEHYDPDFIYEPGQDEIFTLNTDSYLYELLRLRAKYQDQISVGFGVELGLQPHLKRELAIFAKSFAFDFILGSSHLCNRKDPYVSTFFEGRTEEEAHHEYFLSVYECAKKLPYFDIYGHLDYVVRYGPTKNDKFTYEKHADVLDKLLNYLIENEKGIELNTSGYRIGLNQPNPCLSILRRYRELGGELITVGSDAHKPADIASNFDKACELLQLCGFQYYCIFQSHMPEFIKIV